MGSIPKHPEGHPLHPAVIHRIEAGLSLLHEAYDYACQLQRPAWDFAVEIHRLRAAGLTNSDLRWLACQHLVEHAAELTRAGQDGRVFRPTGPLTFTKTTCFILTETGALKRQRCLDTVPAPQEPATLSTTPGVSLVPQWDKERLELRLGKLVVKRFKVPAPNQEMILAAFQEEKWPPRIDDPLPPHLGQDAKRRLHDTINTLNRHQQHPLVHFSGDGSGEGVRWQLNLTQPDRGQSS